MSICAQGSLDEFCLVHGKLLEDIMCILGLADEGPIFMLLDLKAMKKS
jgi:hypothetical protein